MEGIHQNSPTIDLDAEEQNVGGLTSTPLRKYMTAVGEKKESKWICNFGCKVEPYTGSYSRIRAHLIGLLPGQKSQGVILCFKVSKECRQDMKKLEEEAKSIYGHKRSGTCQPMIPLVDNASKLSNKKNPIIDMYNVFGRSDLDSLVARFFYGCGIPFNVARAPFFVDMIKGVNDGPRGYKAPSSEKIRTRLLDKEKAKVDCALMPLKDQWTLFGASIVSDGWSNIKNKPLINVLAVSGGRAMFLNGIDCSGDEKTGLFIAELLLKAIESVGAYNVVQVLTDNASSCKRAGDIIMDKYPHIFWSGCMAHTLSLLMKDIASSNEPCMLFIENIYKRGKGVVKYIKTHSMVSFIFEKFSSLEVIQVKKTRFGHHYVVLERLFRVKNALISMVLNEEWEKIKSGTSLSKIQHGDVKKTILDDEFWSQLKFLLSFTKPIWAMIRFCDSDKAVIGEVYQKMDDMLSTVEKMLSNKVEMCNILRTLVYSRWEKMNVSLHYLAYVLTPLYYSEEWLNSLGPNGEKRGKPHSDPNVEKVYLDVMDRLLKNSGEASIVRVQLSDFVCNTGVFARPQSIKDRKIMSSIQWWNLYGAIAPQLYGVAIKVLSQSVNSSCAERVWSTYGFIHSVKRNRMNTDRAESLVYVHYNHRLLTRYREDYETSYKNWDAYVEDDTLEFDMVEVENREHATLFEIGTTSNTATDFPPEKRPRLP